MKTTFVWILIIALSGVSVSPCLFAQSVTFATNTYATGQSPFSVIGADIFGSGRPAIITANLDDSTLTVLGNFGNGTFASNATYHVSSPPRCVVAADVNGDGKLDLISVGFPTTTVLTNYNSGLFGSNATVNVGGNCAVTFDLNGDGKPDLLVGGNTTVTAFTNNGSGHFGSNATLNVSGPVYAMAVSDVNADGQPDLVVANYNDGSLTVFTNRGSGVLVSNATYVVGDFVRAVTTADINGDGSPDLICGGFSGYPDSTLSIWTNNGSGIFGSNATVSIARACYAVFAADFNGDGLTDLVAVDSADRPGIVSVVTNSSAGFGNYFTVVAGEEPPAMAMADFNGDNKPDLVLADTGASVTVMLNTTLFASPPLNILSAGNQPVLYWKSPAPNSVLQATTNLATPNWFTVTNGSPVQGVTLTNTSPALFFRLISQ